MRHLIYENHSNHDILTDRHRSDCRGLLTHNYSLTNWLTVHSTRHLPLAVVRANYFDWFSTPRTDLYHIPPSNTRTAVTGCWVGIQHESNTGTLLLLSGITQTEQEQLCMDDYYGRTSQ